MHNYALTLRCMYGKHVYIHMYMLKTIQIHKIVLNKLYICGLKDE
jgi:hypothetical protein